MRFKDWKSVLIFTFDLPGAKNSIVSKGKRFKLRGASYQEASHALTCLRSRKRRQASTPWLCVMLVYNDETSRVTSMALFGRVARLASLLFYLNVVPRSTMNTNGEIEN